MGTASVSEQRKLKQLERMIERGLATFIEVGTALKEINESRIYLLTHPSFESYLNDRWGMSRGHAYRLIDTGQIAAAVSPIGDINAAQARELVPLYRREGLTAVQDVWQNLLATNKRVTAVRVREAVRPRITSGDPPLHAHYAFIREWAVEVCHPTRKASRALETAIETVLANPTLAALGVAEALRMAGQKLLADAERIEHSLAQTKSAA
jgi:hypothetical protein